SPVVGVLVDRVGPRRLVLFGGVILALGLALSAGVSTLWHLIALYGVVMTVGANCLGLVVLTPLVSRRFVERRGLVLSIVQSANGFGRAASAPVVQILISTIGWRRSYLVLAAFMAVLVLPLARFFSTGGASRSDRPPDVPSAPSRTAGHDWTLAEAMATPHFWLLLLVYLLTGLGSFFVSLHQLAFAADMGFDTLHAASIIGMGSFLSIGGTIFTGTISDYVGREVSAIIAYGISIVGVIAALFISSADHTWLLWIHACLACLARSVASSRRMLARDSCASRSRYLVRESQRNRLHVSGVHLTQPTTAASRGRADSIMTASARMQLRACGGRTSTRFPCGGLVTPV